MSGVSAESVGVWEALTAYSDSYTCYSSALATWAALGEDGAQWPRLINAGLWIAVLREGPQRFGFSHFEPGLQARLQLARSGSADAAPQAVDGVLAELERSGRVIVAGDGFNLPWHVAHGRRHVPHWYVLAGVADAPEVLDPFACRNDLGVQQVARRRVAREELGGLLAALPREDPVLALREVFAFGEPSGYSDTRPWQWFVVDAGVGWSDGAAALETGGSDAIRLLATHFREHGQDQDAYAQADDLWSIGRHRSFFAQRVGSVAEATADAELAAWVTEHAQALAKRWGHVAPLIMQATLALGAGRAASGSLPDTLEDLAAREEQAARAFPGSAPASSI
jgi:hypothetical protein